MTGMRRRSLLVHGAVLASTAGAGGAAAAPDAPLSPWRPARPPQLDAADLLTGERRTLADFAGRPLLVNFWASWCGPCRLEMPALDALAGELASQGWQFLAINHGEMPERVRRFVAEVPIRGTLLLDRSQRLLKAWGGQGLPATFVLDARGRPRAWAEGERDWSGAGVVQAVRRWG